MAGLAQASRKNSYKPGTYEYLEFATKQHDTAMAPKKPKAKVKPKAKKTSGVKDIDLKDLFAQEEKRRAMFKR